MDTTEQPPKNQLVVIDSGPFANLMDTARFEHLYRVGRMFSNSGMVPKHYAGKPEACMVATLMAMRCEIEPLMFMQHSYVGPDGKPALDAQMVIGLINTRGPFKGPVNFTLTGEGDTRKCVAWQDSKGGVRCEVDITVQVAKDEGWYGRNSKWRSMTDQMLRYRSATWLGRAYCPEVLMGMPTTDEVEDTTGVNLERGADDIYRPGAAAPPPEAPPRPSLIPGTAKARGEHDPQTTAQARDLSRSEARRIAAQRDEPPPDFSTDDEGKRTNEPPPDPPGEPEAIDVPVEDIVLATADELVPGPTHEPPKVPALRVWPLPGSRGLDWERFKREVVEVANNLPPDAVDVIIGEYSPILKNMQKQSGVLHRGLMDWLADRRMGEPQP